VDKVVPGKTGKPSVIESAWLVVIVITDTLSLEAEWLRFSRTAGAPTISNVLKFLLPPSLK
jgi:hypothetical protein